MEGVSAEDQSMVLQNNKEERDWSELPIDILGYIVGKLYWSDRIRIRAVCKSWQQVNLESIPTIDKAAWLMTSRWLELHPIKGLIGERKLRDTALDKVIYIDRDIAKRDRTFRFREYQCVTSRYGWLLLQKLESILSACQICQYLLYSPFTDEFIELPELDLGCSMGSILVRATFYLSSKNSECLVFNVHTLKDTIGISTCRPGDKNWKAYNFVQSHPIDWRRQTLSATYLGGCFYCLFAGGTLGAFDISSQELKLHVTLWPGPPSPWLLDDMYLCGELVAIPRFPCMPYKRERVMKFDFSAKCWVEELNFKAMEHPDLRFFSSSEPLGESSSDNHLYAYLYSRHFTFFGGRYYQRKLMLIEPPLKRVWRRQHLLHHS